MESQRGGDIDEKVNGDDLWRSIMKVSEDFFKNMSHN